MALGQFLGQASANTWKACPFFKGAAIIGRLGALLASIWVTMQSSLIVLYIRQLLISQVPFSQCPSTVYRNVRILDSFLTIVNIVFCFIKVVSGLSYEEKPMMGQICLKNTFLQTIDVSPLNFSFLAVAILVCCTFVMLM